MDHLAEAKRMMAELPTPTPWQMQKAAVHALIAVAEALTKPEPRAWG